MTKREQLGSFELMVTLVLIRLGDSAYGVPICEELEKRTGRDVAVGSVYAALERLQDKGFVTSELGEPTAERGGRAKRYFHVTARGLKEVRDTQRSPVKLWNGLPELQGGGMRSGQPPALAHWLLKHFGSKTATALLYAGLRAGL